MRVARYGIPAGPAPPLHWRSSSGSGCGLISLLWIAYLPVDVAHGLRSVGGSSCPPTAGLRSWAKPVDRDGMAEALGSTSLCRFCPGGLSSTGDGIAEALGSTSLCRFCPGGLSSTGDGMAEALGSTSLCRFCPGGLSSTEDGIAEALGSTSLCRFCLGGLALVLSVWRPPPSRPPPLPWRSSTEAGLRSWAKPLDRHPCTAIALVVFLS